MQSHDPGRFFQTSASIANSERKAAKSKNKSGSPITLPSKILAVVADLDDRGSVYIAEAAATARRVVLETGETSALYTGPQAPLTCLAITPTSPRTLFAGCWDKSIWSWDAKSRRPGCRYVGHGDFVKALLCLRLGGRNILVSGGADAAILVWDVESAQQLYQIKGHARGILSLALDPTSCAPSGASVAIFSSSSDREIRQWTLTPSSAFEATGEDGSALAPIIAHETSVNDLFFDEEGDLWTGSADRSAKCLARERGWEMDTELLHPDYVRAVIVDDEGGWVVTACRDEEVRVWDRATGMLKHTFTGHFEEVTDLLLLPGQLLVSVSIDATIRRWSLKPADLAAAIEEAKTAKTTDTEEKEVKKESLLTEEEERELAELMDDDD